MVSPVHEMRCVLLVITLCVLHIPCGGKPRQSAYSEQRKRQVNERAHKVCVYSDHSYCSYWRSLGLCHPRKAFYSTMAVKCQATCGLCGEKDCPDHAYCNHWKNVGYCQYGSTHNNFMKAYCPATCRMCGCFPQPDKVLFCAYLKRTGYCNPDNQYYHYMLMNCQTSCGFCSKPPTTKPRPSRSTTSDQNTTLIRTSTAASYPSSSSRPTTTSNTTTTGEPTTVTAGPSTSSGRTTTSHSTIIEPTNTSNSSNSSEPITTSRHLTRNEQTTTSSSSTSSGPTVTSSPKTNSGKTTPSTTTTTSGQTSNTSSPLTTSGPATALEKPISATTAEENACLKAHNDRRALHGASPLIWDDTLVQHAQVWADHLAATGKIRHDPNVGWEGENLATIKGRHTADCTDALVGWYDKEEPKYDYNKPGFSPETGHFTQVVWKASTAVGVAQASSGSGFSKQIFIVARYRPGGNYLRIFKENVGRKRSR